MQVKETKDSQVVKEANKGKRIGIVLCIVALCIVALGFWFFSHVGEKNENSVLQDMLMQDWWKFDEVNGTLCLLILDFSKSEVNFIASDFDKETIISTVSIEILSENQFFIKEYDTVFTANFLEDGKQMTVSPGLTSVNSEETWTVMAKPYGTDN